MFFETSAKTAFNVEDVIIKLKIQAFNNSAKSILDNLEKNKVNSEGGEVKGVDLKKRKTNNPEGGSKCC